MRLVRSIFVILSAVVVASCGDDGDGSSGSASSSNCESNYSSTTSFDFYKQAARVEGKRITTVAHTDRDQTKTVQNIKGKNYEHTQNPFAGKSDVIDLDKMTATFGGLDSSEFSIEKVQETAEQGTYKLVIDEAKEKEEIQKEPWVEQVCSFSANAQIEIDRQTNTIHITGKVEQSMKVKDIQAPEAIPEGQPGDIPEAPVASYFQ